jgi:hypothetical protein
VVEEHMGNSGNCDEYLSEAESALCELVDETLAKARRADLWALYEVAGHLSDYKVRTHANLRGSLLRCKRRLRWDRTTILRYAFVYQRIRPREFTHLVAMSDARGYPATFWDFVEVARLGMEERHAEIERRLAGRAVDGARQVVRSVPEEIPLRESSTRLGAAPLATATAEPSSRTRAAS